MKRGITSIGLVVATAAALAFAAQPAMAAETIGQTAPPASTGACDTNATYVQDSVFSGAGYAATTSGVITSWSTYAGSTATTMKLVVLRPNPSAGSSHYVPQAKDLLRNISPLSQLDTFTGLHLAIAAGDSIGVYVPAGGSYCLSYSVGAGEVYHHVIGDPAIGSDSFFNNVQSAGVMNASAVIEPDADGDRYGDETQDGCPGNGAVTGACPVVLAVPLAPAASTDKATLLAAAVKRCKKKKTKLARHKCVKRAKKKFA
jgi:hypothetical protein